MAVVILDTNFLLIPGQFKLDIFTEINRLCKFSYTLGIVPGTITELERIMNDKKSKNEDKKAAKLALGFIKKYAIKTIGNRKVFKSVDEAILSIADANTIIATQDMELKRKLRLRGVSLIIMRKKQYLQLLEDNVLSRTG